MRTMERADAEMHDAGLHTRAVIGRAANARRQLIEIGRAEAQPPPPIAREILKARLP
jgi:hypothetical protein